MEYVDAFSERVSIEHIGNGAVALNSLCLDGAPLKSLSIHQFTGGMSRLIMKKMLRDLAMLSFIHPDGHCVVLDYRRSMPARLVSDAEMAEVEEWEISQSLQTELDANPFNGESL
jgi:hypothetical protein